MEKETYFCGTGRRKCAIAQVKLLPGEGAILVNDIPYEEVFPRVVDRGHILKPLTVTEALNKYRVVVKVIGGGTTGQRSRWPPLAPSTLKGGWRSASHPFER